MMSDEVMSDEVVSDEVVKWWFRWGPVTPRGTQSAGVSREVENADP